MTDPTEFIDDQDLPTGFEKWTNDKKTAYEAILKDVAETWSKEGKPNGLRECTSYRQIAEEYGISTETAANIGGYYNLDLLENAKVLKDEDPELLNLRKVHDGEISTEIDTESKGESEDDYYSPSQKKWRADEHSSVEEIIDRHRNDIIEKFSEILQLIVENDLPGPKKSDIADATHSLSSLRKISDEIGHHQTGTGDLLGWYGIDIDRWIENDELQNNLEILLEHVDKEEEICGSTDTSTGYPCQNLASECQHHPKNKNRSKIQDEDDQTKDPDQTPDLKDAFTLQGELIEVAEEIEDQLDDLDSLENIEDDDPEENIAYYSSTSYLWGLYEKKKYEIDSQG